MGGGGGGVGKNYGGSSEMNGIKNRHTAVFDFSSCLRIDVLQSRRHDRDCCPFVPNRLYQ